MEYKTQEMDREMPALMGVPKAVLESVIFVHQEDANWPLDKADVLKKKFDQIFEATRYTKALESMAKVRKEQNAKVKESKLKLETLQRDKDALNRIDSERLTAEMKRKTLSEEIEKLSIECDTLSQELAEVQSKIETIEKLEAECSTLDTKLQMVVRQREEVSERLAKQSGAGLDDTLEQLLEWQREFDAQVEGMRSKKRHLESEERQRNLAIASLKDSLQAQRQELGKMQAAAEDRVKKMKE